MIIKTTCLRRKWHNNCTRKWIIQTTKRVTTGYKTRYMMMVWEALRKKSWSWN